MMGNTNTGLPLEGVRSLELAEIWAGPYCGVLMGDLGAEVIKVESMQRIARGPVRPPAGSAGYPDADPGERPWNRSANFNGLNRNKAGLTLDLGTPLGAKAFKELVSVSDVVVSNYAYGVLTEKFGLDYETLRRVKPDIVMLLMPGFGNTGPYRRYRSMGMTIDALSGHSALRGYPDQDLSTLSLVHHPDAVGGATAAFAVCAALHRRNRTGQGQFIDMSQSEAFIPHMGEAVLEYGMTGRQRERRGNRHPEMAPHGVYPCEGEDRWVAIAVRSDSEWRAACAAMDTPNLAEDPRFTRLDARLSNHDELGDAIARWTSGLDRYEAARRLQDAGVPAAPVLDCGADAYDDPHLQARDYFQQVTHPEAGTYLLSGPMWKLSGQDEPRHDPAPGLGEHNSYVLRDLLGVTDAAYAELEHELVIGDTPLEGSDMGGVRRVRREAARRAG